MKLPTVTVEKPWGRMDLPPVFADAVGRRVGEIWFDTPGEPLPLLIKWLFTSEKLSIQVHPDDPQAHARGAASGKEECWFIVSAEPDARLGMGTLRPLSADELRAASESGEIEQLMDWKPVKPGDYFYITAGTVHAIGAGITLVEVQQNADITYRLYDYGRPRALHLADGVAVSIPRPYADERAGAVGAEASKMLVDGPYFNLWHARGNAIGAVAGDRAGVWVIPLSGEVAVGEVRSGVGDCLYLEGTHPVVASNDAAALVATASGPTGR